MANSSLKCTSLITFDMKSLIIVTLFLSTHTAFSQSFPVVTPLNEWVVDYKHPVPGWPAEKIRHYTFSADSVLKEGKYYHELIYSINMSGGPWISEGAFLREENGRAYKWQENMPERLLYDFNMGNGDSLSGADLNQATRYVTQVGTTQLLDGVPRKSIEFSSSCGASQWVEGIGEIEALFYSEAFCSLWDGAPYYIRCFSTNGQLLYKRPDISSCYTSSVNDLEIGAIRVFPNPGSDLLYLELENEGAISKVMMYNSLGSLVLSKSNFSATNNSIDISKLPSGFYTGIVHLEGGRMKAFKVAVTE